MIYSADISLFHLFRAWLGSCGQMRKRGKYHHAMAIAHVFLLTLLTIWSWKIKWTIQIAGLRIIMWRALLWLQHETFNFNFMRNPKCEEINFDIAKTQLSCWTLKSFEAVADAIESSQTKFVLSFHPGFIPRIVIIEWRDGRAKSNYHEMNTCPSRCANAMLGSVLSESDDSSVIY